MRSLHLLLGFLFLGLSSCAPRTAACDLPPQTSFVGEVARQAALPNLYVREGDRVYLVSTDAQTNLLSSKGEPLSLSAVTPGTRVWVQGVLLNGEVQADEVRVLN